MGRPAILALALLPGLVGGCSVDEPQYTFPPFSFEPITAPPGLSYEQVMTLAVGPAGDGQGSDIDAFWRRTLPAIAPQVEYEPPTGLHGYARGVAPPNACAAAKRRNAYFCPSDGSIAWEIDFFRERQREIGDLAPLVIMAHEWGHHIQHIWESAGNRRRDEAQADCYSGVYISDALDRGVIGDADIRESVETWYQWGTSEYAEDSWFSESEHGPGQARAWAFASGLMTGDAIYCVSFNRYEPAAARTYPGYELHVPPGTAVETGPNGQYDRLTGERVRAYLVPRADLGPAPAVDQLPGLFDAWLGQAGASTIGDVEQAFGATLGGSGALVRWSDAGDEGTGSGAIHGVLALHVPPGGGGLLLNVYTGGPAPAAEDFAGWEALGDYLYLLMSSLCPDEAQTYICAAPST